MIRKYIWGVPIALVAIGLLIVLFAHLQPSAAATVMEVGEKHYTPAKAMVRGHSSAHYQVMLEVGYTDERGESATATVECLTAHEEEIPRAGDQIRISRGLSGMVMHPNRTLIGIGGAAAVIGGLFLFMFWLTWLSMRRKG